MDIKQHKVFLNCRTSSDHMTWNASNDITNLTRNKLLAMLLLFIIMYRDMLL